jgi:hypothetical protein
VKDEYELYKKTLDPSYYNQLIIGKKGLVQQRDFIMNQWENGKQIVFFDDDILKLILIKLSFSEDLKVRTSKKY